MSMSKAYTILMSMYKVYYVTTTYFAITEIYIKGVDHLTAMVFFEHGEKW